MNKGQIGINNFLNLQNNNYCHKQSKLVQLIKNLIKIILIHHLHKYN